MSLCKRERQQEERDHGMEGGGMRCCRLGKGGELLLKQMQSRLVYCWRTGRLGAIYYSCPGLIFSAVDTCPDLLSVLLVSLSGPDIYFEQPTFTVWCLS